MIEAAIGIHFGINWDEVIKIGGIILIGLFGVLAAVAGDSE